MRVRYPKYDWRTRAGRINLTASGLRMMANDIVSDANRTALRLRVMADRLERKRDKSKASK